MQIFDTQSAMDIISHSNGGFSYDTLARALISKGNVTNPQFLLIECKKFCDHLETRGFLKKCPHLLNGQDEYFEYIHH
ncbi:hypothetical protein EDF78_105286 [Rahnella sp. BIGb0236]|uniref:hypothetical protein n=1 Tax=Rahnella sp. BIGb0236 TaxID=2485117 RepID=UPI00105E43A0|nr:hypothetical protein [Rahnella sp. BIGb0236]TDS92759.1 hypothetical protein EDF78_105286 [Rahnella sp. BIGb0236]